MADYRAARGKNNAGCGDGSAKVLGLGGFGGRRRVVPTAGERWHYPAVSILRIQGSLAANEFHHGD